MTAGLVCYEGAAISYSVEYGVLSTYWVVGSSWCGDGSCPGPSSKSLVHDRVQRGKRPNGSLRLIHLSQRCLRE